MSFTDLLNKMLVLFVYILVGFIANKSGIIDGEGSKRINKVLLYICQPAITISSVLNSHLDVGAADVARIFAYAFALNLFLLLVGFAAVRIMRVKREDRGTYNFMLSFGNVVFVGFPVLSALYGDDIIFFASICSMPFNILAYSVGIILISGKGVRTGPNLKMLLNPAMVSVIVALLLFFFHIRLPAFFCEAAGALGNMVIPGAMLLIGVTLGGASLKDMVKGGRVYLVCLIKLVLSPVLVWLVFRLFIHDELYLGIMVVSAAMPSAVITNMLSMEYGGNVEAGSQGVFMTTLISLVTIPLMVYVLL